MNASKRPKYAWIFVVLRILAAAPAILASLYFMNNIIMAVNAVGDESLNFESFGVLLSGIFLTAIIDSFMRFIRGVVSVFDDKYDEPTDKVTSGVHKTAYILKIVFVATFATFWAIGMLAFTLLGGEDFGDVIYFFFISIGLCAACYGYVLYGVYLLQKNPDKSREIERISTIIFVIAWVIFGVISGAATIEEVVDGRTNYNGSETLSILVITLGPLIYLAQKYLFRWILDQIKKKHGKGQNDKKTLRTN